MPTLAPDPDPRWACEVLDLRVAAVLAASLAACGSYTTYQTAEPLGRGRWRATAAVGGGGFRDQASGSRTPSAHGELALHRGIGAATDVGVKLYAVGAELQVKHRLVDGCWQWALAGAVGGVRTWARPGLTDALTGHLRLTAIATRRTSSRLAYSVGPVVTGGLFYPGGGGHAAGLLVGGFANLAWSFSEAWLLVPELSLHTMVGGDVPVDGGGVAQLGLAVARRW